MDKGKYKEFRKDWFNVLEKIKEIVSIYKEMDRIENDFRVDQYRFDEILKDKIIVIDDMKFIENFYSLVEIPEKYLYMSNESIRNDIQNEINEKEIEREKAFIENEKRLEREKKREVKRAYKEALYHQKCKKNKIS